MEEKITNNKEYKINYDRAKELREENKILLDTLTDCYTEIEYNKNNKVKNIKKITSKILEIKEHIKDIQTCITANTEEIVNIEIKLIEYEKNKELIQN